MYACVEVQARLTLHAHMCIWTTMSSDLLQKCSGFKQLQDACRDVLDSYFRAHIGPPTSQPAPPPAMDGAAAEPAANAIPRGPLDMVYYLTRLVVPGAVAEFNAQNVQYSDAIPPLCPHNCTEPSIDHQPGERQCSVHNIAAFEQRLTDIMMRKQIHQHSFTCHKGKAGGCMCRLCFPKETIPETRCVQLTAPANEPVPEVTPEPHIPAEFLKKSTAPSLIQCKVPEHHFIATGSRPYTTNATLALNSSDAEAPILLDAQDELKPDHPLGTTDTRYFFINFLHIIRL